MEMQKRLKMLLDATPQQLREVDAALAGAPQTVPASLRLYRMGEAAKLTNVSRQTLWRAIRDGHLRAVKIRKGSFRIPESELLRFTGG